MSNFNSNPIKIPFLNNDSDENYSDENDDDIIKINVKRLKNTNYDIILSECIHKSNIYSTYTCINISSKIKLLVDIYNYNDTNIDYKINLIKEISNKNIIKIYDIIDYKSEIYIIREYYTQNNIYNYNNKDNETNLLNYKIILNVIKYLLDLHIELDIIKIDNIYEHDNIIIINPIFKFINTNNNIVYGSPIYSSPNILNNYMKNRNKSLQSQTNIVWNLGLLLYQLMYKIDLFELYNKKFTKLHDINDLKINTINIKSIILKMTESESEYCCTFNSVYAYFNSIDDNLVNNKSVDSDKSDENTDNCENTDIELFNLEL